MMRPGNSPPLAVYGVREVADVEGNDGSVDVRCSLRDEGARFRIAMHEPERNREQETNEDSKGNQVIRFAEGEARMQL